MSVGHIRTAWGGWRVVAGAVLAGTAWAGGVALAQSAAPARSVNDGVYTAAQAARGAQAFEKHCTMCHEPARFTGPEFVTHWSGKPLAGLFETVSTTMPEDNPGSLKPQEYGDIVAYFLQLNTYPTGADELPAGVEPLRAIAMAPRQ